MQVVMRRPEPGQGRDGEENTAARRELRLQGAQRGDVVLHMLQDIEEHDEIVVAVRRVDPVRQGAEADRQAALALRDGARLRIVFGGVERAVAAEQLQVAARAAADLQEDGFRNRGQEPFYEALDDFPAGMEPPMPLFLLGHSPVDVSVHDDPRSSASSSNPNACATM